DERLEAWTKDWDKFELETHLQAHGVAGTACRDQRDRYLDGELREWGTYVEVEHPILGTEPLYGNPIRMERHGIVPLKRAPFLGEHTREVMSEVLGLSEEEIDAMDAKGVLS